MKNEKLDYTNSNQLFERALKVIPGGTQTLSKGPERYVEGAFPKYISSCDGSKVIDEDDNEFIDYVCGLGAIVLGYCNEEVRSDTSMEMWFHTVSPLLSEIEVILAEKLVEIIPCAEKVRFAKNGTDATSGAVRIARAFTGKDHIAKCGYSGWQDWSSCTGGLLRGIPKAVFALTTEFQYNNLDSLEAILKRGDCGTVIMEQGLIEPEDNFLERALNLSHQYGAVFILDEVVTGFRYAMGGASEYYGVTPDIVAIGKAMGNGLPISAICGKAHIMDVLTDGCFFSGTFFGETSAMAAAICTIYIMQRDNVIDKLWSYGSKLKTYIEETAVEAGINVSCPGNGVRFLVNFPDASGVDDLAAKSLFIQEMAKNGILTGIPFFSTAAHSNADLIHTFEAIDDTFGTMRKAKGDYMPLLEGRPIGAPVIRR